MNELDQMLEELTSDNFLQQDSCNTSDESSCSEEGTDSEDLEERLDTLNSKIEEIKESCNNLDECAEACDKSIEEAYQEILKNKPWFEAGVVANALSIAGRQLTSIATTAGINLAAVGTQKALLKGVGSTILKRLNAYTKLHPEVDPISTFNSVKYDLVEATSKFNIGFKLAIKWGEKISSRVEVRVFSKDKTAHFAIAYGKMSDGPMYNSEFVWISPKYKKYNDFYTASAHAAVGIGHPSIQRILKTLKEELKKTESAGRKMIKESAEEALSSGTFKDMQHAVAEMYMEGYIEEDAAKIIIREMDLAGLTDDTFFVEDFGNY